MTVTAQPQSTREGRASYVGALDGLRAIAVAAVIVFHFAPKWLPAGFLGVDVFFVVSGFLIARLLVREIGSNGRLSGRNFWSRRARRLLPAVGVMTVVICIAAAISFTNAEIHDLRAQAIGTLAYVANWVIIAGKGNYFSTLGRPSPFLHMWSLAIEEQFYVVLPLVFLATRRAVVRRPTGAAVLALIAAGASTFYMWVLVSPDGDPSRAYLGSASHAMGLLGGVAIGIAAGAAAAPWERLRARLENDHAGVRIATVAGTVAFVAILLTMRLASDRSYNLYRGGFLVFSLVCAVVIVVVVLARDSGLTKALSAGWLVAIGLRSYSLYLWHWPVRVFITPSSGLDGFPLFLVRLAVSVVLAEISYRLIERPFRTGTLAQRRGSWPAIAFYAGCAVVTVALVLTVARPYPATVTDLAKVKPTPRVAGEAQVDIFGDSTGLLFGLAGEANKKALGISTGGNAQIGCGFVFAEPMSQGKTVDVPRSQCRDWQNRWRTSLKQYDDTIVAVMNGAWDVLDQKTDKGVVKFGTPEWTNLVTTSVRDALKVLTSTGRPVYVFEVPCYGTGDPNAPIPERADPARISALNDIYNQMAREMPQVHIVHWRSLVCPGGKRAEKLDGADLWEGDDVHLSAKGAVQVWKWWLPQVVGRQ
jgi:peptidoglycan/LPS O-acetylase OafA/YrhL